MCGITGLWTGRRLGSPLGETVRRMAGALSHRGPDDDGVWTDEGAGLALGHRRLSILDLSPEGHQPMHSQSGRYCIAFNGEVYNFAEIRRELEGAGAASSFRGHSDTEVMLAAVEAWGVEGAVRRFVGMFAFALWDREERVLHLVRDRLGIKPLFYGWAGGALLFGSELKALRAFPGFAAEIDRGALALYLRHSYVPAPYSIYRGIGKLPPGCILSLRAADDREARPVPFWSAREVAEAGAANPVASVEEAQHELEARLMEAVRLRMIADVPLGAFLSGGVDSSTVVALMQAQSSRPVKTFTIGFEEGGYDEAEHARAVAGVLGTDHTELRLTPAEAMAVIPHLPRMYDEPFADASQIPTFIVSRLARREVTVALSGDGGDELFAGYNRHFWGERIWRRAGRIPAGVRRAAARAMTAVGPEAWDRAYARLAPALPPSLRVRHPGQQLHKLAGILPADSPEGMYRLLTSHWGDPPLVRGGAEPPTLLTDAAAQAGLADFTSRMTYLDLVTYLPDDILTKVDRASMAVGLEARVPLLDHRVVEFAWRVPVSMKVRDGQGKWLLRQVLYRHVPRELIERPKTGFGVPLDAWLRGPLRDWAESLLDERRLREEGFLEPAPVRRRWEEHLSGRRSWQHHLWDVLMFQAWLEAERSPQAGDEAAHAPAAALAG